ncbi:MAG: putative Zn-dependent peptidase [Verrucomicrobia bacterium]|nr:MAG: putative Zn-dependent peptidase [Verrucomicrobiota bacterium]
MFFSFFKPSVFRPAFLCLGLMLAPAVQAEGVDRSIKPNPGSAPAASFPEFKDLTLPNGLRVFIIQDDRRPMVTFRLVVKSGSSQDETKPGTASLVANLLNRGTKTRSAEAFAKESDFLGSRVEAAAGPDSTALIASALNKYTGQLLDLMSDAARNPVFSEEQLAKARKISLSALEAQKQQPQALLSKLVAKVVYGVHPYGNLATPESVSSIERGDLERFHQTYFHPKNATLAVVGDVDQKQVIALIEKAFGSWENTEIPKTLQNPLPEIKGRSVHLVDRPGSVQSNIAVCRPGPRRNTPDLPEVLVLNSTLGGGFSGRLFQNLRETHGWTYGAYSAFDPRREAGSFEASAETRNEVTAPAVTEILKEIDRLCKEPAPETELALQREYNIGNYLLSLEKSDRTAQRVQDIDLYGLPQDFYKTYARRMGAVTPPLMQATAQAHLDTDNICIVVVGEAKDIKSSLEAFGPVTVYDTDLKIKK